MSKTSPIKIGTEVRIRELSDILDAHLANPIWQDKSVEEVILEYFEKNQYVILERDFLITILSKLNKELIK